MREIVLDTETTGLEPSEGHRLVEIGCIELVNHIPTGKIWHHYINPERDVPPESVAVHGLTTAFLKNKPVFSELYLHMIDFIGTAPLVIHNAAFDMKFINAELIAVGHPGLGRQKIVDTLDIARRKFPGSPASLDALCRRFGIDNTGRELHGALLDAQLLADVYLELMGGRQHGLLTETPAVPQIANNNLLAPVSALAGPRARTPRQPRPHTPGAEELSAHAAMVGELKNALWKK